MTDAEIRGRLLTHFHSLRHRNGGWVPISDINLAPDPVEFQVIGGVCQQLADVGLVQWRPLDGSTGLVAGTGKITGQGVAAVEAGRSAGIEIRFPPKNETAPSVDATAILRTLASSRPTAAETLTDLGVPCAESTARDLRLSSVSARPLDTPAQSVPAQPVQPATDKQNAPLIDSFTILGVHINAPEAQRRGRQLLQRGLGWLQRRSGRSP